MRAILVDPVNQTVTEVEHDGNYKSIYKLIDADLFTVVQIDHEGNSLFLDDEGLYREDQKYFQWQGYGQPLAGKGLILGTNEEGDSVGTTLTLDDVKSKVTWRPGIEFHTMEVGEDAFDHPIFGKMNRITNTPIFKTKEPES